MSDWTGPTCLMCDGTGEDFTYSGEPMEETRRDVPTGRPCRACNGHGRDATPCPACPFRGCDGCAYRGGESLAVARGSTRVAGRLDGPTENGPETVRQHHVSQGLTPTEEGL